MTELGGAGEPVRVLVVDDEIGVRNSISRVLRGAGMRPEAVDSGAAALDFLAREPFDVALLDFRMPGMTGPQVLARMKAAGHRTEVIMMTACADIATTMSAVRGGAYTILTKPFAINEFIVIEVLNAAGHKRLRERAEQLERELTDRELTRSSGVMPAAMPDLVAMLSLHELVYVDARRRVLAKFKEAYVNALLRLTGGDMSEAARRSGLRQTAFLRLSRARAVADAEE